MSVVAALLAVLFVAAMVLYLRARADAALLQARVQSEQQAGIAARSSLARLAAGLAGTNDALFVLDDEGRVAASNPAAQGLAGERACNGVLLEELLPWPRLRLALRSARESDGSEEFELDGGTDGRALVVRVRYLLGLGSIVGIDDQSRLRRLESLRRDFVANVSHELKTPLAAIQGIVETLLDDPEMVPATRQRFLERVARQCQRLTSLVADLLTLSRLDEATLVPDDEPCDFVAVVRETVRDLGALADKKALRVHAALPGGPVWIRADRESLRQLVSNLIDNAIKYTPERGAITITAAVGQAPDRVRLEVMDTGIGLSPEDQQRVFERFYRVDRARSRELGGTGLGLSIVKNTVKNLRGEIGVQSRLGHGSTFWVELPCLPAPGPSPGGTTG